MDLHPLPHLLSQELGDLGLSELDEAGAPAQEGDLAPDAGEEVGELRGDEASPHDEDALRLLPDVPDVLAGEIAHVFETLDRRDEGAGPGDDEDILTPDALPGDLHGVV